jgi:hypothetical protein
MTTEPHLDSDTYSAVLRQGRSALAWEVLRRDPAYRAAYRDLPAIPACGVAAEPEFVCRWGLHFP